MSRGIKYRELKRMYDLNGAGWTCRHLSEALSEGALAPVDFSFLDLAEALVPDGREWVRALDPRSQGGFVLEAISAVDTSAFSNISGQIVYSTVLGAYQNEAFTLASLVKSRPTRFRGEKIPGVSQIGDKAEKIDEGYPYPLAGVSEDYIETPVTTKRGFIVPVTREAIFFDRTDLVLDRARDVGNWLGVNKEKRIADAIIDDNTTDHRYKWKGTTYATYQTATPWINLKATNALGDWTDIDAAEQLFENMTDPWTGEPITVMPDTVLVCPELRATLNRILQTQEIRQITGGVTEIGGRVLRPYSPAVSKFLKARLSAASQATSHWYLGKFDRAFAYMENWPITVVQAPPNSEAEFTQDIVLRFKASEMGAVATLDPRFIVKNTAA